MLKKINKLYYALLFPLFSLGCVHGLHIISIQNESPWPVKISYYDNHVMTENLKMAGEPDVIFPIEVSRKTTKEVNLDIPSANQCFDEMLDVAEHYIVIELVGKEQAHKFFCADGYIEKESQFVFAGWIQQDRSLSTSKPRAIRILTHYHGMPGLRLSTESSSQELQDGSALILKIDRKGVISSTSVECT